MPDTHAAFVALGSNLDDPVGQIEAAMAELDALPDTRLIGRSGLYLSRPFGYADQPDFINAVAWLDTRLSPRELLAELLEIERHHGRERTFRNSPRTLDLDILLFDDLALDEAGLHLPHARMHERAFVLLPLAEIAPAVHIPGHGVVADVLAKIGNGSVRRLDPPPAR